MNKRIRVKQRKEKYYIYKGQSIVVNSPYSHGLSRSCKVCLMYCPIEGYELYCKSVGQVKKYLDSIHHEALAIKIKNI